MRKRIKILALAVLSVSPIGAYTNLGILNMGDPVFAAGAKSVALGFTALSSAKNASCVFTNAAAMTYSDKSAFFISLPVISMSERVIPDNDWSAEEGGAYYNNNFYFDIPDAAFVYAFSEKIKLGLGTAQKMSFHYKHEEIVYSGGNPLGKFDYRGTGALRAYDFALSFKPAGTWAYGITWEMIKGKPSVETNVIDYITPGNTKREKKEYNFSGSRTNFSLYRDKGLWNYGVSYAAPAGIDYDLKHISGTVSTKYKGELELPRTIILGINHIWAGAVSASVYFDIVKTYWSDMNFIDPVTKEKNNYKDRTSCHLGIENDLSSTLQLRYGMALIPSYESSFVERAAITAGLGYYLSSSLYLDLGFAYGRRNYIQKWESYGYYYNARINETMKLINLSLDWRL